jgi:membrane fusion protein, multidrug efflux system
MSEPVTTRRAILRRRLLMIVAILLVTGGALWLAHHLLVSSRIAETDNAYVGGDIIQVTAQVTGPIAAVLVDDARTVAAGQELVRIDAAEARFARERAEADLAAAVRSVRQQIIAVAAARAQIDGRTAILRRAEADLARRQQSAEIVSEEDLLHAREAAAAAQAECDAAEQTLAGAQAAVDGTTITTHPLVLTAAARLRQTLLDEARCSVRAPVSGLVVRRTAQPGTRVQPGTVLLAIVPLGHVWVDANFKEGQLERIRPGLPVDVVADAWGDAVTYHGTVVGLAAGTGSAFALLPPQNASGNWIKIVQRIPVRIALDPVELAEHPLRIGMSTWARVHLDATPVETAQPGPRTDDGVASTADIDRLVERIIAANAGTIAEH